ncbi:helix-turn-helix transcriptional regulator [Niabella beijingensis]|uniref:helix-turn-helix transcriptional regulator n=1 Tax=Niabella beijingensis TaxID=2872700 RepID=UPI001CBDB9C2|nr:response regulator transcription factor [Niabella beijingensis]MBZ4189270.1 response regulator transcription factor [Niabella beijingensis]
MLRDFFSRNRALILYGVILALLVFLLKWLQLKFVIIDHAFEIYAGSLALLFTLFGIWLARRLTKPRTVIVEKAIYIKDAGFICNRQAIEKMGLSERELEVLQLMAEGLSNQEIAGRLFISLNTIKTHSSRLFEKMDVKRRTQAVEKARRLCIIP